MAMPLRRATTSKKIEEDISSPEKIQKQKTVAIKNMR